MARQQAVELILVRRWASMLVMPVFIVGADGTLLYFNEAAEPLIGQRFEESGPLPVDEIGQAFDTRELDGSPIPTDELPLAIAMFKRRPAHRRLRYRALDGKEREVEITAMPLIGQGGRFLGALSLFWETEEA